MCNYVIILLQYGYCIAIREICLAPRSNFRPSTDRYHVSILQSIPPAHVCLLSPTKFPREGVEVFGGWRLLRKM